MEEKNAEDKPLGVKEDQQKLRMDLIPPKAIIQLMTAITYGSTKYTDNNWRHLDPERIKGALLRHLFSWMDGTEVDEESGIKHLSLALSNLAFLVELEEVDEEKAKAKRKHDEIIFKLSQPFPWAPNPWANLAPLDDLPYIPGHVGGPGVDN